MIVRVKLFAVAKERAGQGEVKVDLPAGATVADLCAALLAECPNLATVLPHALWAVDAAYASPDTRLAEQSEVALIPPVSGG